MGYDDHRFKHPDTVSPKKKNRSAKKGGDLDDEGGVDRYHRERGQDLKVVSRESHQRFYRYSDEGVEEGG